MEKQEIGKITHFFDKISVAVIALSAPLNVGDRILVEGQENRFEQEVDSMQMDHDSVQSAKAGQEVGLKVAQAVKHNDKVFKLSE